VLTLCPKEDGGGDGGGFSSRRLDLEARFAEEGAHAVGLQEARARAGFRRQGRHFMMVSAAAEGGAGGVALWLRRDFMEDPDVFVLLADSRRLFVAARTWSAGCGSSYCTPRGTRC